MSSAGDRDGCVDDMFCVVVVMGRDAGGRPWLRGVFTRERFARRALDADPTAVAEIWRLDFVDGLVSRLGPHA